MELRASSNIEIELLVPNENFVPVGVLRRAGNFVMQRVVDIGLPQVKNHRGSWSVWRAELPLVVVVFVAVGVSATLLAWFRRMSRTQHCDVVYGSGGII